MRAGNDLRRPTLHTSAARSPWRLHFSCLALLAVFAGLWVVGKTPAQQATPPASGAEADQPAPRRALQPRATPQTPGAAEQAPTQQPGTGGAGDAGGGAGDAGGGGGDELPTQPNDTKDVSSDSPSAKRAAFDNWTPLFILAAGIAIVLGLIIIFKVNAFIALITAAMVVSVCAPGDPATKIKRVADAFGSTAGGIGVVIALAAVIGKAMLDSGAADRIVRAFVSFMGEKRAPIALMGSGYVLAIPVFFDTVFYLLVPLARSLHRRTGVQYLKYILAIGAGGALTHSLVPPTPGPLLMASTLNVDLGLMIMAGALVALPAAFAGVIFADLADRVMKTPMRQVGSEPDPEPLSDKELPSLGMSLLPVLLPVLMISTNTVLTTVADLEPTTELTSEDFLDWPGLQSRLGDAAAAASEPGGAAINSELSDEARAALAGVSPPNAEGETAVVDSLNAILAKKEFYSDEGFLGVRFSEGAKSMVSKDTTRMRRAVLERRNRLVLEETLNTGGAEILRPHTWETPRRQAANISDLFGNANLALLISTVIALWMLVKKRGLSKTELAGVVETSLMSGGVIILITAGGGAFGAMLKEAQIGEAIQDLFEGILEGQNSGMAYLYLGFLLASVLKIAQGSGTVAMIVGSSMMAAIVVGEDLGYSPVYLATAIGAGSLVGSWMNDSGFWIFAKMGGLTETEALKSWTFMLVVLGAVSFGITLLLARFLPLI
ncbi:MAG: SLC13 family permease [Pirellulaceae bacterium]|nr:SLC13 family permease [Pirellulaceae bacterium]MDP7014276.1 SLC13 family permease [Pirellulaceae bacterium]